jgi:hypothetical protein
MYILPRDGGTIGLGYELIEASASDKDTADTELRTSMVESNNLVLQKELQPRRITMEQKTNFMALTRFLPKISRRNMEKICLVHWPERLSRF